MLLVGPFHDAWDNYAWTFAPVVSRFHCSLASFPLKVFDFQIDSQTHQSIPNTYKVVKLRSEELLGIVKSDGSPMNEQVVFTDRGVLPEVANITPSTERNWLKKQRSLPDPELIALHHALCHVLHMSGAGEAITLSFDHSSSAGTPVPSDKIRNADDLVLLLSSMHLQ